jgi:DNA mismatch repair ATPase MutS
VTYSHTLEDILRIAKSIKEKSGFDLKLVSNEYRGYYLRSNRRISLSALSDRIEDDVIQISERGECVLFSTSMLVSLSNRLKESEKKLILLSEGLLRSIIEDVQKSIEVLFDINYELSVLDMVLAFAGFVRKYPVVQFTRPVLVEEEIVEVEGLKTVWTKESKFRISEGANLRVGLGNKVLIFQKTPNSFDQLNLLYSMGYLTILAQIGCFVPASKLVTGLFTTLMSKIHLSESIESNLSHFQLELHHFKAILDNSQHQNSKCLILLD